MVTRGWGGTAVAVGVLGLVMLTACLDDADPCPPGLQADEAMDRCVPVDGGGEGVDAGIDGGADGGVDAGPACAAADLDAWTEFHRSDDLVGAVDGCQAGMCSAGPCDPASCLAEAAGVEACGDCVAAEVQCALRRCSSACTKGETVDCVRCACEAGCIEAFEGCARVGLPTCADAFGEPPGADELVVPFPTVIRRKSTTGFTRTAPFVAEDPTRTDEVWTYAAIGWTHFVALSVDGVDYLAEMMNGCGDLACPFRISPLLADGRLGPPAYEARWRVGWDVFTTFELDGALHLFAYKSGESPVEGEPKGAGRVLRIEPADGPAAIDVEVVDDRAWSPPVGQAWTHIRGFAVDGRPYLFHHRPGDDLTIQVLRVESTDAGLRVEPALRGGSSAATWDVVETFPVGPRWFVLRYATAEEEAHVEVSELLPRGDREVAIGLPLITSTWPAGLDRVLPFRTPANTYLLRQNQSSGAVDFLRLPPAVDTWSATPGEVVHEENWGADGNWDVVAVLRARLWEAP